MTAPGAEHCAGCRGFTRDWASGCEGLTLEAVLMACARHPDDRAFSLARDFTGTLKARAENPGLLWRELVAGRPGGPYWQDWYCEPPAAGAGFRVPPGREEWTAGNDDMTVRRIYEIEVIDAAAEERARPPGRPGGVRAARRAGTGTAGQLAPPGFTGLTAAPPQERPAGTGGGP